jgi:tRNA A-37 threonylcarbamoyl transferase component Bud32
MNKFKLKVNIEEPEGVEEAETLVKDPCPTLSFDEILEIQMLSTDVKNAMYALKEEIQDYKNDVFEETLLNKMRTVAPLSSHHRAIDAYVDDAPSTERYYNLLVYETPSEIIKAFVYNKDSCSNFVEFMALREIVFIRKAHYLNKTCRFFSPDMLGYGKICLSPEEFKFHKAANFHGALHGDKNKCILYFIMEKLQFPTLKDIALKINLNDNKQIEKIVNEVNDLMSCLSRNGIYHNDETFENIMYDFENQRAGLIDFGLTQNRLDASNFALSNPLLESDFSVEYFKRIAERLRNLQTKRSFFEGGRKRKTKNKRKRTKTRSKRQTKRRKSKK